jgi:hypothetical protein
MSINQPATGATVRQRPPVPSWVPRSQYQWIAVLIWILGALATELLVRAMGVPHGPSYVVAVAIQWALTLLERPMWRDQRNVVSFLVLCFDVVVNAAGLTPFMERLGATPVWIMFHRLGAADGNIGYGIAVAVAFVIGFLIAITPEKVWGWR